jgi:2-methylcitrate dehydratase
LDTNTHYLASYASGLTFKDLPEEVIHKTKGLLIDTLACAMGGYTSEPGKIARRMSERISARQTPATILGSGQTSTPELATFANGVMIRYLDFNDGFVARSGGHPSDNFAPVITCADALHAGGREVIVASVLAYEVFCRLFDRLDLAVKGFDQSVIGVVSCVMGASKILGLSQKQMVQALNLAIVANLSLQQTRIGEVSMWKACAMANAGRNAVFAASLAKEGLTGPGPIFEGRHGFFNVVSGPFHLNDFGGNGRPFRIMDATIKRFPCGLFSQSAVDAALKLRSKVSSVDEIAEVTIGTFTLGKAAMGSDPEKWHPPTRESADHSLPYVVATALKYGSVELKHFQEGVFRKPDILKLMAKIKVEETEECNRLYPGASPGRIDLTTTSGRKWSELVLYHRGHFRNPMNDEEIEEKFQSLTKDLLPQNRRDKALKLIWDLEHVEDIHTIMELFKVRQKKNSVSRSGKGGR